VDEQLEMLRKIDSKYGSFYKANNLIFEEGDIADKFYILRQGLVKIVKTSNDKQITINTIEEGEVFGEMGLITNKPRNASAITLTESFIVSLNEKTLYSLIKTNKKFLIFLLKAFGSKIRYLSSMVKDLTTGNDFVIITTHFVNYLNTVNQTFNIELNLYDAVKYISIESKIPFEVVSKNLKLLEKEDVFTITKDKIYIKDKRALIQSIPRYF
jgi:CRP/FNR family transcriptional regulator, cyclic AMP receptor protein